MEKSRIDLFFQIADICTMKRLLYLIIICAAAFSCRNAEPCLQTGDLIFVGIPMDYNLDSTSMSSAISAATGEEGALNLIHVAIAEVKNDSTWIIDATIRHGVDRHPLDTFLCDFTLKDGSLPAFIVKRVEGVDAEAAVEKAKEFIGQPYDVYFMQDNGAMYCSELVREAYLDKDGKPVFENEPMNFCAPDGTMPIYWEQLFALIGSEVPQGAPGTNPQRMSQSNILKDVPVQSIGQ